MVFTELYIAEEIMHTRAEERANRSKERSQANRLKQVQPGWLLQQRCLLLCQLGHLLVRWGEQLKQYNSQQPLALKGPVSGAR